MIILGTNSIKDTGYNVANSLRFNDGSSDNLSRSTGTPSSRQKFTFSTWIKLSSVSGNRSIFNIETDGNTTLFFMVKNGDQLHFVDYNSSAEQAKLTTNALYRDPSAWMHVVLRLDSTQGTNTNRCRLYVNGEQITSFSATAYPDQNYNFTNNVGNTRIGISQGAANYWDGYMAETVYCDGQSLAPDQFGEFDSNSEIWKPIDVSGLTFGDEGFYLDYENSGALGADVSGESNNFTVNNLTAIDQSTDTCTNNFTTLNPLFAPPAGTPVYSDGNLTSISDGSAAEYGFAGATTIGVTSGKWYCEGKCTLGGSYSRASIGVTYDPSQSAYKNGGNNPSGKFAYGWTYRSYDGVLLHNDSTVWDGNTFTTGDIIGVYIDLDNHKLYISKNGTLENSGTGADLTTGETYHIFNEDVTGTSSTSKFEFNFGSPSYAISSSNSDPNGYGNFEYSTTITGDSVSKDFYAINTKNLVEYG